MNELEAIAESIMKGQAPRVKELIQAALNRGIDAKTVLDDGLIAAMAVVGQRFKNKEMFLPEVLFAARAMHSGMKVLEPLLISAGSKPLARVVLGTVKGDIHDIGKNLVGIMLKGAGFEVIDIGIDTPCERFMEAARGEGVKILGISALISTSMPYMKTVIDALEASGLKGKVKTIVGGAIVTQSYADSIGADGFAPDAAYAVDKAKELLGL